MRKSANRAVVALLALVGVVVFTVFERTAQSQSASLALSARSSQPAATAKSKIAFISLRKPAAPPQAWELNVMNADGSGKRVLTRNASLGGGAWSPDGRKIAFVRWRDDNWEVYVVNADGSGQRRLTRDPAYDDDPAWSPDGQKIAFVRFANRNFEIYVMNADGSDQRRLTGPPRNDRFRPGRPTGGRSPSAAATAATGNPTARFTSSTPTGAGCGT